MEDPKNNERKKVFFITSNETKLDKLLEYQIPKNRGIINLKAGYNNAEFKKEKIYNNLTFSVYINSFEIEPKNLKKEDQDTKSKKYKIKINLKYDECFSSDISFRASRYNFIYDFKFNVYMGFFKSYAPPNQLNLSKLEQLKIYDEYLDKVLKKEKNEQIYSDLVTESQSLCFIQKIYLDYFLEIFKICYTEKTVKHFLKFYKLENILIPINFEYNDYEPLLGLIENDFNIITRHLSAKEDKFVYYYNFYTLLFYKIYNYEKKRAFEMLNNKNLWKYFIKILPAKYEYFPKLNLPEELKNKLLEQDLDFQIIIGSFNFFDSIEKILIMINSKIDIISNCGLKKKKMILMSTLGNPKKEDNLEKIIEEIEKIINYEANVDKIFISFDEEFWNNYINFHDDLNKLIRIKNTIILCSTIEENLENNNNLLNYKIHQIGLNLINNGNLKNEKMLDFIKNDIYFSDDKFANKNYRPLDIVKGLDFDTMSADFFKQWNDLNIFKIYSYEYDLKIRIVDKLKDIKHFRKLLELFDYKNKKIFDMNLFMKLRENFKNFAFTYKPKTCPNFIEDMAYFIYIVDYQRFNDIERFLYGAIEKYILSQEIIINIYIYFITNYKDISEKVIESIINYFIKLKKYLNAKQILHILEKCNSKDILKLLLNLIECFSITEYELFNQEKNYESFKLLDGIQKKGYFNKPEYDEVFNGSNYLLNAIQNISSIECKIKNGEIKYTLLKNCYIKIENREIFKEKLKIIFFNNKEDIEKGLQYIERWLDDVNKVMKFIDKLLLILENFFKNSQKTNITKAVKLYKIIINGKVNEIEKPEIKKEIEEIKNIFSKKDFEKYSLLVDSLSFINLLKAKELNNIDKNENEILEITEIDFKKLKIIFDSENWYNKIPESMVKECFKFIKNSQVNVLNNELNNLQQIFGIKNFKNTDFEKLEKNILIVIKKEEIILTVNGCINLINELVVEKTDFYKELKTIDKKLQKNIIKAYFGTLIF